ncbi:MAG: GNAT family N-acetyltransferase, partial [Ktedonobacterales bacterium]
ARHCGFDIERHIFESTLDVPQFDEQRFAGAIARVESAGIRCFTLADLGDTEDARRALWDVERLAARDIPGGSESSTRPFDVFERQVCQAAWYRPDAQIIAAAGDRWVGMTALGYYASLQPFMWQMMTGVDPTFRGRGIALALKLLGIRCAARYGAAYIRTNNDSENAPMLAINRALGFRPEPGAYRMARDIP